MKLAEELGTLRQYLEIEQARLPFQLLVTGLPWENLPTVPFPSMLLHTFAENALWHGLAPKGKEGTLTLEVTQPNPDELVLKIEDNGIGRAAATAQRSATHQSRGLLLAQEKIRLYNQSEPYLLTQETLDLHHPDGTAAGTRVVFKLIHRGKPTKH